MNGSRVRTWQVTDSGRCHVCRRRIQLAESPLIAVRVERSVSPSLSLFSRRRETRTRWAAVLAVSRHLLPPSRSSRGLRRNKMSATAFRSRTTPRHAWSLTAVRVKHRLAVTSLVWTVSPCVLALMVAQNTRVKVCSRHQSQHLLPPVANN